MNESKLRKSAVETKVTVITSDEKFTRWDCSNSESLKFRRWFARMVSIRLIECMIVPEQNALPAFDSLAGRGSDSFDQHKTVMTKYHKVAIRNSVAGIVALIRDDLIALI